MLVGTNIPFYITFYFDVPYACDRTFCAVRYFMLSKMSTVLVVVA